MKKHKVLDIFYYISKNIIDLKQLENIFNNRINDTRYAVNDYHVERYVQGCKLEENIKMAVSDLENEGKCVFLPE